jgi:RNA-directed DNA polymerase
MSATARPAYEWKDLPWRAIERRVFKLQTRIYRAQQRGDGKAVHRLQRLLIRSWSAKCLAVRRVTQDNRGKKTAGVDGVKALTPPQRLQLAHRLSIASKAQPVRRVWIPKPHTPTEQRALGIPVMHDRASQALVKQALEPEWEAKFEPNSYGFRPGRSCHDAIEAIFDAVRFQAKFVLDADIAHCFDRINQTALVQKLGTFPLLRRVVRQWLRAGVLDGNTLFPTEAGTPQGGVISPLLANIALHGMEDLIAQRFPRQRHHGSRRERPTLVRYADDLVVLHADRTVIVEAKAVLAEWLLAMGLELKPSKTRIVHTLHEQEDHPPGFDFLGFTVRQFSVGKRRTAHNTNGKPLGFKTIIKPSKAAGTAHQRRLKEVLRRRRTAPQLALISELNPIVRGWSRYYAKVCSASTFSKQDALMFQKLWRWAVTRHPRSTSRRAIKRKYWHNGWKFSKAIGERLVCLQTHAAMPISRHVKVRASKSPYDGDWVYWSMRLGRSPEAPTRVAKLLRRQQGRCQFCGLYFTAEDRMEIDHIRPRSAGGPDAYANLQLLHRHCHDRKSTHDKGRTAEEPCTGKLVRTVLNERRAGRPARRL